jgi:hypothetical protein
MKFEVAKTTRKIKPAQLKFGFQTSETEGSSLPGALITSKMEAETGKEQENIAYKQLFPQKSLTPPNFFSP